MPAASPTAPSTSTSDFTPATRFGGKLSDGDDLPPDEVVRRVPLRELRRTRPHPERPEVDLQHVRRHAGFRVQRRAPHGPDAEVHAEEVVERDLGGRIGHGSGPAS